jgi:hypothetical protein
MFIVRYESFQGLAVISVFSLLKAFGDPPGTAQDSNALGSILGTRVSGQWYVGIEQDWYPPSDSPLKSSANVLYPRVRSHTKLSRCYFQGPGD